MSGPVMELLEQLKDVCNDLVRRAEEVDADLEVLLPSDEGNASTDAPTSVPSVEDTRAAEEAIVFTDASPVALRLLYYIEALLSFGLRSSLFSFSSPSVWGVLKSLPSCLPGSSTTDLLRRAERLASSPNGRARLFFRLALNSGELHVFLNALYFNRRLCADKYEEYAMFQDETQASLFLAMIQSVEAYRFRFQLQNLPIDDSRYWKKMNSANQIVSAAVLNSPGPPSPSISNRESARERIRKRAQARRRLTAQRDEIEGGGGVENANSLATTGGDVGGGSGRRESDWAINGDGSASGGDGARRGRSWSRIEAGDGSDEPKSREQELSERIAELESELASINTHVAQQQLTITDLNAELDRYRSERPVVSEWTPPVLLESVNDLPADDDAELEATVNDGGQVAALDGDEKPDMILELFDFALEHVKDLAKSDQQLLDRLGAAAV